LGDVGGARGRRPADLEKVLEFGRILKHVAVRDPAVHKVLLGVQHLLMPQSALNDPEFVRRVTMETAAA
jgi:hypothetical protein